MEQTITPQSELLQSRLRNHKAEAARSRTQSPHSISDSSLPLARDDDIFLEEDSSTRAKKGILKRSSPAAPSAWRYDRDQSRSRLSNGVSSSTNTTPRAMGAREMEEHIDRLTKLNFDLKMEVFHRREKIEQLEKRLADYAQLEEDLTGALDANEELVTELEARDRAVDEAVVIISDLEQRNRELELQLAESKTLANARENSLNNTPTSPRHRPQNTPRKSKNRQSLVNPVPLDDSPRIPEPVTPSGEPNKPSDAIPSFLKSKEPTTAALRSMFVESGHFIRPLPSHATLTGNNDNEDYLSGMKSPRLSELSESDLKSIYDREEQTTKLQDTESADISGDDMARHANARVSKWVAERAVSPATVNTKSQDQNKNAFQSLNHMLKRQPDLAYMDSETRARGRQPPSEKNSNSPPTSMNPSYGQNAFPPTPDTMNTRTSNASSASFRTPNESSTQVERLPSMSPRRNPEPTPLAPNPAKYSAPSSLLPQEFDAYGSPPQERKRRPVDIAAEYSDDAIFHAYSSDGSFTQGHTSKGTGRNQNSYNVTTATDSESFRDALTSPNAARQSSFDNERGMPDVGYPNLPYRSFASAPRDRYHQPNSFHYSMPARPPLSPGGHDRSQSTTSNVRTPTQVQPLPLSLTGGMPPTAQNEMPPPPAAAAAATTTSPIAVRTTKSLAARTASIRDRFLRRKIIPAPALEPVTTPTEAPVRRSGSITRKLRLRRSSSGHAPMPELPLITSTNYPFSVTETSTVASTTNTSFFSSSDQVYHTSDPSNITLPSLPQRAKSERHRPSKPSLGQADRQTLATSNFRVAEPITPESYGTPSGASYINHSPGSMNYMGRPRRPSVNSRLSNDSRVAHSSSTDIPPVPATPPEILKWDAESDSASNPSKWRIRSRSRSTSRSRKDPTWPTLTAHDGTFAGRRM